MHLMDISGRGVHGAIAAELSWVSSSALHSPRLFLSPRPPPIALFRFPSSLVVIILLAFIPSFWSILELSQCRGCPRHPSNQRPFHFLTSPFCRIRRTRFRFLQFQSILSFFFNCVSEILFCRRVRLSESQEPPFLWVDLCRTASFGFK